MDLSIIEFLVYGLIGYLGIVILIISVIRYDEASSKSQAVIRSVWLMPSILCLALLSFSDSDITLSTVTESVLETSDYEALNSTNAIIELNSTTNTTTITSNIIYLRDPVWGLIHIMLFFVLTIYQLTNFLLLLPLIGKRDNK